MQKMMCFDEVAYFANINTIVQIDSNFNTIWLK